MTDYKAPLDDMNFLINDVFSVPKLWQSWSGVADVVDGDTAQAILTEAAKIMAEQIHPLNQLGDEQGCVFNNHEVFTPKGYKEAYQAYCEGGWNALGGDPAYGGMGMPKSLVCFVDEMLQGASLAFGLAPMLTAGACLALNAHGSDELKQRYLPNLYNGKWSAAMDLTEPHAGTDLGLIRTKAIANDDDSFAISGTKIFITWGEHDMAENIIHLVLAKLPDAPEGSRGISMFLVPKFLVNDDGSLGERNGLSCGSIEHKMGIHGSATCVMNFDGAQGWLVGEPHKGLKAMFTMMNDERLAVGVQGLGVAECAYQQAVSYARDRRQGRSPAGAEEPDQAADNLLVHADVRRMLLTARAYTEAARAFIVYLAIALDKEKYAADEEAAGLVALLTPVAKAFITDMAFDSTVLCQQVLGGHGYIREWGLEQYVRDARIAQIYEGTNGIQAMDLLGRKTVATEGKLLAILLKDVKKFIADNQAKESLKPFLTALQEQSVAIEQATQALVERAQKNPHTIGSAANDYCHWLGHFMYLYMWSMMVAACDDDKPLARQKWQLGHFYLDYLLPQTKVLQARVQLHDPMMGFDKDLF